MVNGKPLFCGKEESQLETIFKKLGKPEVSFPAIEALDGWKAEYSQIVEEHPDARGLEHLIDNDAFVGDGMDLLQKMLVYDPAKRISAQEARNHVYFSDLPESFKKVGSDF